MALLKRIVQRCFAIFGFALVRLKPKAGGEIYRGTTAGALHSLAKRGYQMHTVIDIGASDGRWSASCMQFLPNAQYLLVEAQAVHNEALMRFTQTHPNAQYVLAAAGDRVGTIYFDAGDPFGGQASHTPLPQNNIEVPVTTLDNEVAKRHLQGPFLVKFDTHGFEVPILQGALATLENTDVIVMECYVQELMPKSLPFAKMCQYLDDLGFRCIDFVDPVWRPYDDSFWQMDLVFIKISSAEFTYRAYE
jgi:FkbM family methyltransferase